MSRKLQNILFNDVSVFFFFQFCLLYTFRECDGTGHIKIFVRSRYRNFVNQKLLPVNDGKPKNFVAAAAVVLSHLPTSENTRRQYPVGSDEDEVGGDIVCMQRVFTRLYGTKDPYILAWFGIDWLVAAE